MSIRILFAIACSATLLHAQQPVPSPVPSPSVAATPQETPQPGPPPSVVDLVGKLKDDEVSKSISIIKEKFLDQGKIDDAAIARATLEGLMERLAPGAALVDTTYKPKPLEETPFLAEILDEHIGYLRLGTVEPNVLPQVDAAISSFKGKKIDSVILDLRGTFPGGDFETAADIARRFCSKGKLLFSIQKPSAKQERIYTSNQDPVFQGVIVVLTDSNTEGAAEVLAATLRQNAGAMIVGEDTRGGAAEFTDIPVSGGLVMRVAVSRVMLAESDPIFPDGVKADVVISLPQDVQAQIFRESKEKGVSQFVFENERRRLNEAALVANLNPEIDSAQSMQREKNKSAPLRDTVLQRAVDLITTISFYRSRSH